MNKKKIFNDPVYGFINVPYNILFDIIEHPYFQRLRRIKQVSLTHYVYPGALHTRFHHALGAMHLMQQALDVLSAKKIKITKKERKAALIAILLHDIGHGPFSHTLEHTLMNVHHETLSTLFMKKLNCTLKMNKPLHSLSMKKLLFFIFIGLMIQCSSEKELEDQNGRK